MTLSIMVLLLWLGFAVFIALLPANKAKATFVALLLPSLFLGVVWSLERFSLAFSASKAIGGTFLQVFPNLARAFEVPTAGLKTTVGVSFIIIVSLLLLLFSAIVTTHTVIGTPPWQKGSRQVPTALVYDLLAIVLFGFSLSYFAAGTRNVYSIKTGFMEPIFELLCPYLRCFV